jgi:hypothetical protein
MKASHEELMVLMKADHGELMAVMKPTKKR